MRNIEIKKEINEIKKREEKIKWKLICVKLIYIANKYPSKHFNIVSTFSFGQYNVATWDNVKSMLKQRCVFQRYNSQRWINVVYFNIDMNNIGKHRNNVLKMTISKKNKNTNRIQTNRIHTIQSFNYYFIFFFTFLPMLKGICQKVLAQPRKFSKDYETYCIART